MGLVLNFHYADFRDWVYDQTDAEKQNKVLELLESVRQWTLNSSAALGRSGSDEDGATKGKRKRQQQQLQRSKSAIGRWKYFATHFYLMHTVCLSQATFRMPRALVMGMATAAATTTTATTRPPLQPRRRRRLRPTIRGGSTTILWRRRTGRTTTPPSTILLRRREKGCNREQSAQPVQFVQLVLS